MDECKKNASDRVQKGNCEGKGHGSCLKMLFLVHSSTKLHHPREPPDFSFQGIELYDLLRFFASKPFYDSVILSKETQSVFENKRNAAVTP